MDHKSLTDLTCRVCLNVEELMVNIYDEVEDFQSNLVELLQACGGLMVDRGDSFPKYLCKVCAGELLVAAKFREKCAKSNELLSQMIPKVHVEEPPIIMEISSGIDDRPYACLSDEMLDEIIEEVEDNQETEISWSESHHEQVVCENIIPVEIKDDHFNNLSDRNRDDDETPVKPEKYDLETVEDFIVFDNTDEGLIEETIPKKKVKTKMKKMMQKAAPLKYDCDECGAAFSSHENLRRHLRIHPEFADHLQTCQICLHTFTKQTSLQTHGKTCQLDPSKQSLSSQGGNTGAKRKTNRNEICDTCGKVCNSEASLRVHIRTHTNDRPYPCTECPKAFKTQAALSLHLKRHAGQFDWECEVCGKQFVESSNLRVHMRTHTGEKPHLCKVCGRKFSRVFLLQLHLRTHTGEKPYKCETCHKAFTQKSDLEIHTRTHTGVRPYVCPICFRGFVKSYVLQKHFRQHPKEMF